LPRIGVITGTQREAACLSLHPDRDRFAIACSGADAARAQDRAASLRAAGCAALLSFGVAGGLDPALAPGTVIVAEAVIVPNGGAIATHDAWRAAVMAEMRQAGIAFTTGAIVGADSPIADVEPKRVLFAGTGALGVDMESHAVIQEARRGGIPCLVVRAVADGANDEMPDIAMTAIGRRGEIRYWALTAALLRQPSDLAKLVRLGRMSRPAFASLRRVAALPGLGGPL
jgi:hopanoid-associated phosphorylase